MYYDGKAEFSATITSVLSVILSFRYGSNILIWCSDVIKYYWCSDINMFLLLSLLETVLLLNIFMETIIHFDLPIFFFLHVMFSFNLIYKPINIKQQAWII